MYPVTRIKLCKMLSIFTCRQIRPIQINFTEGQPTSYSVLLSTGEIVELNKYGELTKVYNTTDNNPILFDNDNLPSSYYYYRRRVDDRLENLRDEQTKQRRRKNEVA